MTITNMQKRLVTVHTEAITLAITQALAKARMGPRSTFTEVLLRWLPSDATRPDCLWIDLDLLRDEELQLVAEEHT